MSPVSVKRPSAPYQSNRHPIPSQTQTKQNQTNKTREREEKREYLHRPKKQTHRYIRRQIRQIKRKERPGIQCQPTREIHDDGKDQCLGRHVQGIDEDLCDPEGGGSVEGVGAVFVDDGSAEDGGAEFAKGLEGVVEEGHEEDAL